eukprot:1323790-Pyramimonas_sp.AAC.1
MMRDRSLSKFNPYCSGCDVIGSVVATCGCARDAGCLRMPRITVLAPCGTSVRTRGCSLLSSPNSASGVCGALVGKDTICLLRVVGDVGAGRARRGDTTGDSVVVGDRVEIESFACLVGVCAGVAPMASSSGNMFLSVI